MGKFALSLPVVILTLAAPAFAEPSPAPGRYVAQSTNFVVYSHRNGPSAAETTARCEQLREDFRGLWLGAAGDEAWRPRCEVVLHGSRSSYLQAVGRGGGQTSGSSLVRFEKGRLLSRRIDLLVGEQGGLPALRHELTHVVLGERFGERRPPRWVDEGIATMADSAEKRGLHHRDCHSALSSGTALRLVDLLRLERFTSAQQVPAFYGQSLSLVHFLAEQEEPGRLVEFAEAALDVGYDRALQKFYDIDGVAALERQWRGFVARRQVSDAAPAGRRR